MAQGCPYRALNYKEDDFRLLVFESSDYTRPEAVLRCQLQHESMRKAALLPDFYAVSYTWGDVTKRSNILVGGEHVSVPQNAEAALRQFINQLHEQGRSPSPRPRRLYIWIDAICINHADQKERSRQLSLMNAIYTEAKTVLIWLGEDNENLGTNAIESIHEVVDQCKTETNDLEDLFKRLWDTSARRLSIRTSKGVLPPSCNLHALRAFYSSRWFTRLWVIQEACLAKQALCFWGSHVIPLYDVALAAQWMWYRGRGKLSPEDSLTSSHIVGIRNATEIWDCMATPYATPKLLWTVLAMGMEFETSDPLDKVYGMFGLIELWLRQIPELQFVPDYSVTQSLLYAITTKAAIMDAGNLAILSITSRAVNPNAYENEKDIGMPSWVPRFDWTIDRTKGSTCSIQPPLRGASNGSPVRLSHVYGMEDTLIVQGLVADTVAQTLPLTFATNSKESNSDSLTSSLAAAWNAAFSQANPKLNTPLELAFALTLCAGQDASYFPVTSNTEFAGNSVAFFQGLSDRKLSELGGAISKIVSSRKDSIPTLEADAESYLKALTTACSYRSFFITADGRLGIGPSNMRNGDRVCILPGSAVPLILRKEGVFWRFVGDAYVHEIMDVSNS